MTKIYSFKSTKRSVCKKWMVDRLIVGDIVPIQHKNSSTIYAVVARTKCLTKRLYPILLERYAQIRSLVDVKQETETGYLVITKHFIEFMFPPVDVRGAKPFVKGSSTDCPYFHKENENMSESNNTSDRVLTGTVYAEPPVNVNPKQGNVLRHAINQTKHNK